MSSDLPVLLQVGDALLDVIFDPDVADGAGLVIDGFPRTALQVPYLDMQYIQMSPAAVAITFSRHLV